MRSDRGFTLLEIVMALVVFAISITSILAMFTLAAASHRRGVEQTQARLIARRVFAEVQAKHVGPVAPKDIAGARFPDYGGAYTYDVAFKAVANSQAYHVIVVVYLPSDTHKQTTERFEAVLLRRNAP
jgi:prepilin-type N-terminal cleavage/methylation domain-containing protein